MTGPIQSVSALSFTRQLDGVSSTASSTLSEMHAARQAQETSFETTLSSMAGGVVANLRGAEGMSFAGIAGEADTRQVVDAVMTAEQSLQTAIAIRDKIVSAYLEISRIQI